MKLAFKKHWPEYLIEAWALGMFMISACLFTALFEYSGSPLYHVVTTDWVRRGWIGVAMGVTAVFLMYCPWGKRSGAHMNPSVTFAFWRLGKVPSGDAVFYVIFQFIGGYLGVIISALLIGSVMADPSVAYAVTVPGPGGVAVAWWAELAISFLLMAMVLITSNTKALSPWTGVFAGILIALYVLVEAPLSGMSMNPARTLGSALPAHLFKDLWIYFTAPPLGMWAAAEGYRYVKGRAVCAKLVHGESQRCIFCEESS